MKTAHTPKNTARHLPDSKDPSGTSPHRYSIGTETTNSGYDQQPDNHPAADERMIEPKRGE